MGNKNQAAAAKARQAKRAKKEQKRKEKRRSGTPAPIRGGADAHRDPVFDANLFYDLSLDALLRLESDLEGVEDDDVEKAEGEALDDLVAGLEYSLEVAAHLVPRGQPKVSAALAERGFQFTAEAHLDHLEQAWLALGHELPEERERLRGVVALWGEVSTADAPLAARVAALQAILELPPAAQAHALFERVLARLPAEQAAEMNLVAEELRAAKAAEAAEASEGAGVLEHPKA